MDEPAPVCGSFLSKSKFIGCKKLQNGFYIRYFITVNLQDKTINLPGHYVKTIPLADCLACVNACNSMEIDIMSLVFL